MSSYQLDQNVLLSSSYEIVRTLLIRYYIYLIIDSPICRRWRVLSSYNVQFGMPLFHLGLYEPLGRYLPRLARDILDIPLLRHMLTFYPMDSLCLSVVIAFYATQIY